MGLPRLGEESFAGLVLDELVRQPREGSRLPRAPRLVRRLSSKSSFHDEASSSGCDGRVRGKDAGRPGSEFYRGNRGRSLVPPSAAGRHRLHCEMSSYKGRPVAGSGEVFDDAGDFLRLVTLLSGEADELPGTATTAPRSGVPATWMPRPRLNSSSPSSRSRRSARRTVFVLTPSTAARSRAGGSRSPVLLRRLRSRAGSRRPPAEAGPIVAVDLDV